MKPSVAVIILTRDEAMHLPRALATVAPFAASVHVIDSGSTDDTVAIARAAGAEVLFHPWKNYADQFRWAMAAIASDAEWIMRLDADEVVAPELARRIISELPRLGAEVTGINTDRRHIFMGRPIRFGGRGALTLLRIIRRGKGRIEQRWMDEHLVVDSGRTVHFGPGLADHNLNDLGYFTDKHNRYATREALDILISRHGLAPQDDGLRSGTSSWHAASKRWLKVNLYNRLPFALSSTGYFLYRYVVLLGFLDGRKGLVYHFLQGYWYRFLVGAKVMELERAVAHIQDKSAMRKELSRLTGLDLGESDERD